MRSCNSELPHDLQVISSEFRPIPTISSLTELQFPHKYSLIGIGPFPAWADSGRPFDSDVRRSEPTSLNFRERWTLHTNVLSSV